MTHDIGPQRLGDRRGWLVFASLPTELQAAEDSTQAADHARLERTEGTTEVFHRPATKAERILLQHLGYALPADLRTRVQWISNGVRNRSWLALENGS